MTLSEPEDEIQIDTLKEGDFQEVVRIFSMLGPRYTADVQDPRTRDVFNLYLGATAKRGLVARCGGSVAGVVLFELSAILGPGYLHARNDGIAVDPEYRGRGIAKRLLRRAFDLTAAEGAKTYMIKASDRRAIEMYRRMDEVRERGVYFYVDLDAADDGPVAAAR